MSWFKQNLKNPPYFPRCLVDDRILWFRNGRGKIKKTVTCPKCGIAYARTAIKDADPERWNLIRKNDLYEVKKDHNNRVILFPESLRTRIVA